MARIETTPAVKVALYALRVYLIILLLLIVVKFLRLFPAHPSPPKKTAAVMRVVAIQGNSPLALNVEFEC